MLISNSRPKSGDIVAIKLTSGEEIIGKLVADESGGITIHKPIAVRLQMVEPGQAAIGFQPFMYARDEDGEFTFNSSAIAVVAAKVRDDIKKNYLLATTGLEIPTGGSSLIK